MPAIGVTYRIRMSATGAYPMNLMAADGKPGNIDLGFPEFTLAKGTPVDVLGPVTKTNNGLQVFPVKVAGHDGAYWVRAAAVESVANLPGQPKVAIVPLEAEPLPTWSKILIGVSVGSGVLGVGGYLIARATRKRSW